MPPCTWSCLSGAVGNPNPQPIALLGLPRTIAELARAYLHRRRRIHYRAPPPSYHAHWLGSSGEPLSQPRVPIDVHEDGEHDGGDLVVDDLAVGELSMVNRRTLLLCQ